MRPRSVPNGAHYLVLDKRDGQWSFWQRRERYIDVLLIDWLGASDNASVSVRWNDSNDWYVAHVVRKKSVDAILMAALHLDAEQWYQFAQRQAERQAERIKPKYRRDLSCR